MRTLLLFLLTCIAAWNAAAQESDSLSIRSGEESVYYSDDSVAYDYESGDDQEYETTHSLVHPSEMETTNRYRSEDIAVKQFDEETVKEIAAVDFRETAREKEEQLPTMRIQPISGNFVRIFMYILIAGLVIFLLYSVIRNTTFRKKKLLPQEDGQDATRHVENIEELDIAALLERAIREGKLRIAVRLQYLALLKKLNSLGVIVWKKDKTNREYLSEVFRSGHFYNEIRELTTVYEKLWYGQYTTSTENYDRIFRQFESVSQKLKEPETT